MKQILALVCIIVLCTGLLLYNIFDTTPGLTPDGTSTTTEQANDQPASPAEPATQIRIQTDLGQQQIWQQIATEYSAATGVEIVFIDDTMAQAPTLFTVSSAQELETRQCQDLSGTTAYAQLADMDLTLKVDGKVAGLAADIDCFGLICNNDLLIDAGYTASDVSDITGFSALVQGLGAQGYTAFAGRSLSDGVAARLASLPGNIRTLARLWVAHTSKAPEAQALGRFMAGDAVFYLGSTDEYDTIIAGGVDNLSIMPIYLDTPLTQKQSLCVTAKAYWCVSSNDPEEVAAATTFLDYLVTPNAQGQVGVDTLQILAPYRQATYAANPLETVLRQDLTAGKGYLVCPALDAPPPGFIEALTAFAQAPTDANWAKVEATMQ